MNSVMIDVREREEFAAERVAGSINLPLSELGRKASSVFRNLDSETVILMCRSGKRAGLAQHQLEAMGLGLKFQVYDGGILEWKKHKPTETTGKAVFPIMRQVQLIAGSLVVVGAVLGWTVHPNWIVLSGFVGFGIFITGATGYCGMAELLNLMPWNRRG